MIHEACMTGSHGYLHMDQLLPRCSESPQHTSGLVLGPLVPQLSYKLWLYGLYTDRLGLRGPGLASLAQAPCRYAVNMKVIFLTSCLFFRPYAAQVRLTGLFIEDYFYLGECGDISWQQGQFPPIFGRFLAVFGQLHYVIGQVRIRTPILTHPAVMMSLTNPWFWCIDVTSLVTNTDQWSQQLSKPAVFNTHG